MLSITFQLCPGIVIINKDQGLTWSTVQADARVESMFGFIANGKRVLAYEGNPSQGRSLLSYTTNAGTTWKRIAVPDSVHSIEMDYDAIYYTDPAFVWRSMDGGESWQKCVGGMYGTSITHFRNVFGYTTLLRQWLPAYSPW